MSQLWQQRDELYRLGVKVVVVTFEPSQINVLLHKEKEPQFPYYFDVDKKLYHHYDMQKADFLDVWGFGTLKAYFRLLLRGKKLLKSEGDVYQRGGDVLIDPQGMVRFHHISIGPSDRPSLSSILSEITTS